ncbi:TetR/AcrR family transcriptional regulator [Peptoniphilus mikwangii]|uniref:TetR/AcrR family transcriptional regulator n=1 Tax=Peptoniphilus mikwangii TaxID=1354300 RepID=UPI0004091D48|nr:TetR/AcrR family transcriptional regulator [Peptoniphilus mikwangii]
MNNSVENVKLIKESILTVAYDLFSKNGYTKTNINEIAAICGISRTPIYYHFGNKENLHRAALKMLLKKYDKRVDIALYNKSSIENRIVKIMDLIFLHNKELFHWQQDIIKYGPKESYNEYVDFLKRQAEKIKSSIEIERANERKKHEMNSDALLKLFQLLFNGLLLTLQNNVFEFNKSEYDDAILMFVKLINSSVK